MSIRLPKRRSGHLTDDQVRKLLAVVTDPPRGGRTMVMLMFRCGLRMEEIVHLVIDAVDYRKRQALVSEGKGAKARVGLPERRCLPCVRGLSSETIIEIPSLSNSQLSGERIIKFPLMSVQIVLRLPTQRTRRPLSSASPSC